MIGFKNINLILYPRIITILNGTLFFQETMEALTTNSINPEQLKLEPVKERIPRNPVSDQLPRYEQPILYGGCKLSITTPAMEMSSLTQKTYAFGDCVVIPVSTWFRAQLDILETFVARSVNVPEQLLLQWSHNMNHYYKPIYDGKYLSLSLSKWCRFTQNVNGQTIALPSFPRPNLGMGRYSITLDVPHVYIGPHKSGHLYSINFRVSHIHYEACPVSVYMPTVSQPMSQPMMANQPMMSNQSMYLTPPVNGEANMSVQSVPQDIPVQSRKYAGVLPTSKEHMKPTRERRRKHVVNNAPTE